MGYAFYFWSNENGEPIHIHVSKGKQTENATKFWIKRDEIELVHNKSNIPSNDLKKIQKYLWANRDTIIARWYQHFGMQEAREITVKDQIKAACDVAGISATELGKKMGMSQQNFSKRLQVGKFSKEEYEKMAEILGAKFVFRFEFPNGTRI